MAASFRDRFQATHHRAQDYPCGGEVRIGVSGAVRGDYRSTVGRNYRQFCDYAQRTSSTSSRV